jgi:hypothetical protein
LNYLKAFFLKCLLTNLSLLLWPYVKHIYAKRFKNLNLEGHIGLIGKRTARDVNGKKSARKITRKSTGKTTRNIKTCPQKFVNKSTN